MPIKLASYNIQYGVGKDEAFDLSRIVREIGDADIVALQEVESGNPLHDLIDEPAELVRLLGHPHWTYGVGPDIYLGDAVPGGRPGLRRRFGNMILSRWPLLSIVNHTLPTLAVLDATGLQRTALEVVIDTPGQPLRLCTTHLDHLSPMTRMPQVRMLQQIALEAAHRGPPWFGVPGNAAGFGEPAMPWPLGCVLVGDMNFAPDGPEYQALVGDVSPMTGARVSRADGLHDVWTLTGHEAMDGVTFIRPGRPRSRLDHCFVTTDLRPAVEGMSIDELAVGSDHQPIFVTLDLRRR